MLLPSCQTAVAFVPSLESETWAFNAAAVDKSVTALQVAELPEIVAELALITPCCQTAVAFVPSLESETCAPYVPVPAPDKSIGALQLAELPEIVADAVCTIWSEVKEPLVQIAVAFVPSADKAILCDAVRCPEALKSLAGLDQLIEVGAPLTRVEMMSARKANNQL